MTVIYFWLFSKVADSGMINHGMDGVFHNGTSNGAPTNFGTTGDIKLEDHIANAPTVQREKLSFHQVYNLFEIF